MEDVLVSCRKCGNKVPASSMRLDFDEKLMICQDCIKNKNTHKEIEKELLNKKDKKQTLEEPKSFKIAHKCTSCSYKFRIDPETKMPRNCPYCNARVMGF